MLRSGVEAIEAVYGAEAEWIVGEIPTPSVALQDFMRECNRGRQVWFVADAGEFAARIEVH